MTDATHRELLNSLPGPFRKDAAMADFLVAFEKILLADGLEGQIDKLASTIDPEHAPLEDLRWIAGWMGLKIDADYPTGKDAADSGKWEKQYRTFVAQTMARYQQRGTMAGMQNLLQHFTGLKSEIWTDDKPHRFVVQLVLDSVDDMNELERLTRVAHALIQREKPAHTYYELKPRLQTFQVALLESIDEDGARKQPRAVPHIARPAQVGGRKDGKIIVGNMMLGQAPLNT